MKGLLCAFDIAFDIETHEHSTYTCFPEINMDDTGMKWTSNKSSEVVYIISNVMLLRKYK